MSDHGSDPMGNADDPRRAAGFDWPTTRASLRRMSKETEVTNPFEDENGIYHVLVNDEGQHSLWPSFVDVPKGWTIVHKADSRAACLEFVNRNWTDMRPNSLIRRMQEQARQEAQDTAGDASAPGGVAGSITRH